MHAMFYLSAIPAGLALTVMAIYLCMRSLNVRVDFSILSDCGRMIQMLLIVYAFFKVLDLVSNQALGYRFPAHLRSRILLAGDAAVPRHPDHAVQPRAACAPILGGCTGRAQFVVAGFMVDRINVSINSLQSAMGTHYVPKWSELASSVLVIAAGVMAFRYAVIYLDILPKAPEKPAYRWISNGGLPAQA